MRCVGIRRCGARAAPCGGRSPMIPAGLRAGNPSLPKEKRAPKTLPSAVRKTPLRSSPKRWPPGRPSAAPTSAGRSPGSRTGRDDAVDGRFMVTALTKEDFGPEGVNAYAQLAVRKARTLNGGSVECDVVMSSSSAAFLGSEDPANLATLIHELGHCIGLRPRRGALGTWEGYRRHGERVGGKAQDVLRSSSIDQRPDPRRHRGRVAVAARRKLASERRKHLGTGHGRWRGGAVCSRPGRDGWPPATSVPG